MKLVKSQANIKQHPKAEHLLFENYSHFASTLIINRTKIIGNILKYTQNNNYVCIHEIIRLIKMKMKMKMKNRSQRYDIYRPSSRRGLKYSKYKKCLSIMMLICKDVA